MLKIAIIIFVVGLWGCTASEYETKTDVLLSVSGQESSKSGGLTAGDEVAVFARVEGTESYFLEGAKYGVGSDGHSLTYGSTVYYPEAKQAVQFYAYFPYHTGTFSVPTDQSTATALKQADLCWANASTTPVPTVVPLSFEHQLARLVVSVDQTPSKITMPNAWSAGTLDAASGVFRPTTRSDVSTTGNELIVPAQPLTRLVLTVAGKEYPFTPTSAVTLPAGQTTVLHLTLHPISQTATLAAPVVTTANWTATSATDEPGQAVNNQFTAHWLVADYRFNQINKISLTIKDQTTNTTKDYTVSGVSLAAGSTVAAASYTFALSNLPDLHYPYTVSAIKFYQDAVLVHTASVTNSIVRPGAATLGWGQSISLTLSAATASVAATATSSTFTVTSNVPYASTYTAGGASAQGVGAQPPYTAYSVTFTYPAQGSSAAAVRTHVMTITPTEDYTGNPNRRTFTVTQAAVPTSLSISAEDPGENVPKAGKVYLVDITSNTSWKSQNAAGGVTTNPASGTGNRTGVQVIVPASGLTTARVVSIDFVTTAALSGVPESTQTWLGMQEPPIYEVNGVKWAIGNLVATGARGPAGVGGCKIGAPMDGGLRFLFGSLIGYKGGALANGGNGVGVVYFPSSGFWGGDSYSWNAESYVWPTVMVGTKTEWVRKDDPNVATLDDYYFNYSVAPYNVNGTDIRPFSALAGGTGTLATGRYAAKGVGDPCTYYLGGTWRLPTATELAVLVHPKVGSYVVWANGTLYGKVVAAGNNKLPGKGVGYWLNPNGTQPNTFSPLTDLFFPMSGSSGSANYITPMASSTGGNTILSGASKGSSMLTNVVCTWACRFQWGQSRFQTVPVRCVQD